MIPKPRLLLLDEPHPKARAIMESVAELDVAWCGYKECCGEYDGVYTQFKPIPNDLLTMIKFVACPCTGIGHLSNVKCKIIHLDEIWKQGPGMEITSTAEHTWRLILQLAKTNKMQLKGKYLGIIGYGRIGQRIAKYAEAFDMNILGYDNKFFGTQIGRNKVPHKYLYTNYKSSKAVKKGYIVWDAETVFQNSDIITLHVPLNDSTRGMIGREQFAMMKPGALLVNTARQEIVDKNALMDNIASGHLGGYADDFKGMPWEFNAGLGNIIQTPHIAGNSVEARMMTDIFIAEKVVEYLKGVPNE